MKGSELLAALQALTPEQLDRPVMGPQGEMGDFDGYHWVGAFNDQYEGEIIALWYMDEEPFYRAKGYVPPPAKPGSVGAFLRQAYDPARARKLMDFGAAVLGDASVRQDCSGFVSYVVQDGARE